MLRIAVCDDEEEAVRQHAGVAEKCLRDCGCMGEIERYTRSDQLLADIEDDGYFFDLILLDIEMPGPNGMELAERIKPRLPNVRIIFITSHLEYAIDAFELSIFRYVPKEDIGRRLSAAICDAVRLIMLEDGKSYTIASAGRMVRIPYRDILYIGRDGKNARITADNGVFSVRKSLQQVHAELDAQEFIFIDRGCIANLIHILRIEGGMAIMRGGTALAISRSHLQEVKERINAYWGSHI